MAFPRSGNSNGLNHTGSESVQKRQAAKRLPWWRYHVSTLYNRKVQSLPGDTFKGWVNTLCVARSNGGVLPSTADIAFALHMSVRQCEKLIGELKDRRLIDDTDGVLVPHDFTDWQYESDVSTPRVKEFRKRQKTQKRNVSDTAQKLAGNVTATSPERAEQIQTDTDRERAAANTLEAGWKPKTETLESAKADYGLTDADLESMASRFLPYYRARTNERRTDWDEQFLLWCVLEAKKLGRSPKAAKTELEAPLQPEFAAVAMHLRTLITDDAFSAWFKGATIEREPNGVSLHAPSAFARSHWVAQYEHKIITAMKAAYPTAPSVEIAPFMPSRRAA
jgi:hypothetical protein